MSSYHLFGHHIILLNHRINGRVIVFVSLATSSLCSKCHIINFMLSATCEQNVRDLKELRIKISYLKMQDQNFNEIK